MTDVTNFERACIRDHCRAIGAPKYEIVNGFVHVERDLFWERIGTVDEVLDAIARGAPIKRAGSAVR